MEEIPNSYNVYFNGWNRSETLLPIHASILHHPRGDVKKVSIDDEPAVIIGAPIHWSNGVTTPPDHHFRSILDIGTIEPGSSGGPMFNEDGVIVGQLHGGNANCEEFVTYHGRLCKSWNEGNTPSTRLQNWLDPNNIMGMSMPGFDPNGSQFNFSTINGVVLTSNGMGINGVAIDLHGNADFESTSDENGQFSISDVPYNGDYDLRVEKNADPLNGVTTFDLVLIQRHILGIESLDSADKVIAADANQNGSVSTIDLVAIRRVILGIDENFPNNKSWIFTPNEVQLNDISVPVINQNFMGIKIGDVNQSVDPSF